MSFGLSSDIDVESHFRKPSLQGDLELQNDNWTIKRKPYGRESSVAGHQDDCPSLGVNPLVKETSMDDLLGLELEQHLKFYK